MVEGLSHIEIKGASEHNLKDLDLKIPRQKITVVTGVSGSGKSSLVFDTILVESQRRFFQTLSYYSRQFLETSTRPSVKGIKGLSPAIALGQMETQASTRATVGTFTDIAELLGVMFARFGRQACPEHKRLTKALSQDQILRRIEEKFSGKLIALCAPLVEEKKGHFKSKLNALAEKGYVRVYIDGKILPLTPVPELVKEEKHTIKLILDYVRVQDSQKNRLSRALNLALSEGDSYVECFLADKKGVLDLESKTLLSTKGGCSECGFTWPDMDSRYFAINSLGRCEECDGLGEFVEEEEDSLELISEECESCSGTGLDTRLRAITIGGYSLHDLNKMPLSKFRSYLKALGEKNFIRNPAFKRVWEEISSTVERIHFSGLSYLNLSRRLRSLSGGEFGRLKLAGTLSESLRGVLYILDEPSQGLHPKEIKNLLKSLERLKELGNTIILVDHDTLLIKHADWVVDLGPGGGSQGGELLASFAPCDAEAVKERSLTAQMLLASDEEVISKKTNESEGFLHVYDASIHNLKIPKVRFLKGAFNVVCGVSGSGKTSLVVKTLYPQWKDIQYESGDLKVELIDRKPIAKSSVSMPVTYLGAFTAIRELFGKLPDAQLQGLTARSFSLHTEGGRCEHCGGRGEIIMTMKFLPDARVRCEYCDGKRYKDHLLQIHYRSHSIADILNLTIEEACELFKFHKMILKKLLPAKELGLGYLKLGQTTLSLSGGENQRLKLAPFLTARSVEKNVLILDEPTRGLHDWDVKAFLEVLKNLVSKKLTVLCIEHHSGVIRQADWVVELGPGASDKGGRLIFEGDLRAMQKSKDSLMNKWV